MKFTNLPLKLLIIVSLLCFGGVMLTSCVRDVLGEDFDLDLGELLVAIYITENEQQFIYEIYENRFIFVPFEKETVGSDDINLLATGKEISRSEMREIRRLLKRVLANERGSLGLLDSAVHVTIKQGDKEIHFTRGMSDLQESEELVSRVLEIISS